MNEFVGSSGYAFMARPDHETGGVILAIVRPDSGGPMYAVGREQALIVARIIMTAALQSGVNEDAVMTAAREAIANARSHNTFDEGGDFQWTVN